MAEKNGTSPVEAFAEVFAEVLEKGSVADNGATNSWLNWACVLCVCLSMGVGFCVGAAIGGINVAPAGGGIGAGFGLLMGLVIEEWQAE